MNSLIGTIILAGTDVNGTVRLLIHTEEKELRDLTYLPLLTPVRITLSPVDAPEKEKEAQ